MKFIFARHGETHENLLGISMSQVIGGTLTENGVAQASRLADYLKSENIGYIYTSDLQRAVDTAKIVAKFHPKAHFILSSELRERHIGVYAGGKREVWQNAMYSSTLPFHKFKPEGGESYEEAQERIFEFYSRFLQERANETVLVMSHRGILTTLLLKLFNKPLIKEEFDKLKVKHTDIIIYEPEVQKYRIKKLE